jgi:hypothetical protein
MWVAVERWHPDGGRQFLEVPRSGKFPTKEAAEAYTATLTPEHGGQLFVLPESAQASGTKPRGTKLRKNPRQSRH